MICVYYRVCPYFNSNYGSKEYQDLCFHFASYPTNCNVCAKGEDDCNKCPPSTRGGCLNLGNNLSTWGFDKKRD